MIRELGSSTVSNLTNLMKTLCYFSLLVLGLLKEIRGFHINKIGFGLPHCFPLFNEQSPKGNRKGGGKKQSQLGEARSSQ